MIDRPVPVQRLKELGPRAADLLEPIAKDPAEFPTRRAMALDGLAVVAPDRAARVLGPLARDEKQPVVLRVAAVHAAAAVLPDNEVQTELRPVLEGRHAGLRGEAAEVLSRKGGCAAVRTQAARERVHQRGSWARAMSRCSEAR